MIATERCEKGRGLRLSILVHLATVAGVVLASAWLPKPWPETMVGASSLPMIVPLEPAPPRAVPRPTVAAGHRGPRPVSRTRDPQPSPGTTVMEVARTLPDVGPPPDTVADFDPSGGNGCGAGCVLSGDASSSAGEPGGESSLAAAAFVRPGGDIRPPRKLRDEVPAYPELARRIRVEGEVVVECMIDERGRVLQVQVLRGHPLLAPAAAEAVKRWVYQPTLLNGVPVQVLMTVTVQFQLR